jgi:hypothetical protein
MTGVKKYSVYIVPCIRGSTNYGTVRTPCFAAGSIDGHGVFRLHKGIGFADDHVSLKMTVLRLAER